MKIYHLTAYYTLPRKYIIRECNDKISNDIIDNLKYNTIYSIGNNNSNNSLSYYFNDKYIDVLDKENPIYNEIIRFKRDKNISNLLN